jgi:hypothetical protein
MNITIPTPLVDIIFQSINVDATFSSLTETQKQKVFNNCIELWLYIFSQQDDDKYINIHNSTLDKYYVKLDKKYGYKYILNILEEAKILEINNKFKYGNNIGNFPKSYRVLCNFTTDKNTTEININLDKVFNNIQDKQYWIAKYPQYAHLIEDCYKTKIELNDWVSFLYANENMKLKSNIKNGFFKERYLNTNRIMDYIMRAIKINVNNLWFGMSAQGRFYSSVASLPSIITPFIRLDNQPVVSIDIPNCQPLLLSSIINNKDYKKDVENGVFYEKLGKIIYGEWNDDIKQKVKLQVMIRFFNEDQLKTGDFFTALNFLYPGFIKELNLLKETNKIAHITHKMESLIMVDGVGSLNMNKLLKHDEVMIYKENFAIVKRFIENKIFNIFSVKVNIKDNK